MNSIIILALLASPAPAVKTVQPVAITMPVSKPQPVRKVVPVSIAMPKASEKNSKSLILLEIPTGKGVK